MSTAKGYHDALLALSGNPVFAAARDTLLASISDKELLDVITHGLKTGSPRETLNAIATRLLDGLATARNVDGAAAPVEGKHGGDDDGDDDDSGSGGVRKSGRGAKPRKKTDEGKSNLIMKTITNILKEGTPRRKRGPPKPAQTPTSQGTPSSTTNKKRTGDCLMQEGKKRRNASPQPMDDDEDCFKAENVEELEVVKVPAKKVIKKPSGTTAATNSNTTASPNTAKETDSDLVTSCEDDEMWKKTQELSIMQDLHLVESDENYAEGLRATGLETQRINKVIQVPEVNVLFRVPTRTGFELKKMSEFPISFVKIIVRKFNEDYLKASANRGRYQKAIREEDKDRAHKCVFGRLYPLFQTVKRMEPYANKACSNCYVCQGLCARLERSIEDKVRLVIYPQGSKSGGDWQSLDFWVRQ